MILQRHPQVIFREEDDLGLLFNPQTGKVNTLNSTGKFIWLQLDGKNDKEQILQEMLQEFEISDLKQAEADFDNFIQELRKWGVLQGCINTPFPLEDACLGITSRCNFSCKHCLNRNLPLSEADLTTQELFGVIDQLGNGGVKKVSLFGGEPLCHPDFKEIVEYLNQYPINLSLNTNGTLIDSEMARWLKGHKIGSAIVSFDGSRPEIMDAIRGEGAFEKCLKGIKVLCTEGMNVLLSVTLNKINYQDIKEMVLLGRKLAGNSIRFNHVFFAGNAACFAKELYLSPEEERQAIKEVWQLKQVFGDFIHPNSSYLCQKEKLEKVKDYKPASDKLVIPPCGAARNKCAIRPDGWVVPCEIIWEVKCGNLRQKTLQEIWQNSEMMNSFRLALEIDLNQLPECKNCSYQYLCFIGHRCYPYYYPGGVHNRSLYCWLK